MYEQRWQRIREICAIRVQINFLRQIFRVHVEAAQIKAAGVLVRHIRRVIREWVAHVRVLVAVIARILPAGRHLNLVHILLVKANLTLGALREHV